MMKKILAAAIAALTFAGCSAVKEPAGNNTDGYSSEIVSSVSEPTGSTTSEPGGEEENFVGSSDAESSVKPASTTASEPTSEKSAPASTKSTASSSSTPTEITLTFRNKNLLNQHYQKHGIDMGFKSAEEYEQAAARVTYDPEVLHKIEKEDGDDVYYIERTNEFVVVSTDGYIRTYFLPDSGRKYFDKQ